MKTAIKIVLLGISMGGALYVLFWSDTSEKIDEVRESNEEMRKTFEENGAGRAKNKAGRLALNEKVTTQQEKARVDGKSKTTFANNLIRLYDSQVDYGNWPAAAPDVYPGFSLQVGALTSLPNLQVHQEDIDIVVPLTTPNSNNEMVVEFFDTYPQSSMPTQGYTKLGLGVLRTLDVKWGAAGSNAISMEILVADDEAAAAGALFGMMMRDRHGAQAGMTEFHKDSVAGLGTVNLRAKSSASGIAEPWSRLGFYRRNVFVGLKRIRGSTLPDLVPLALEIDAMIASQTAVSPSLRDSMRPSAWIVPTLTTLTDRPSVAPAETSVVADSQDPSGTPLIRVYHDYDSQELIVDSHKNPTRVAATHFFGTSVIRSFAINENLLWGQGQSTTLNVIPGVIVPKLTQTFVEGSGEVWMEQGFAKCYAGERNISFDATLTHDIEIVDAAGNQLFHENPFLFESYHRHHVELNRDPIAGETLTINDLTSGTSANVSVLDAVQKISGLSVANVSRASGATLSVYGENFTQTSEIRLTQAGAPVITCVTQYVSPTELSVTIPTLGAAWVNGVARVDLWDYSANSNLGWQHKLNLTN